MAQPSLLKTRKQYRKHYIERDSPRIYRRKNRQQFPRKDQSSVVDLKQPRRSGDPVALSEIMSEIMATLAGEFKLSSRLRGRK